jgi:hypothetical protein
MSATNAANATSPQNLVVHLFTPPSIVEGGGISRMRFGARKRWRRAGRAAFSFAAA